MHTVFSKDSKNLSFTCNEKIKCFIHYKLSKLYIDNVDFNVVKFCVT